MSQPLTNKEELIELLKRKKLVKEAEDLKDDIMSFDDWIKFTKEDLKKIAEREGLPATLGDIIFNKLHPKQPRGSSSLGLNVLGTSLPQVSPVAVSVTKQSIDLSFASSLPSAVGSFVEVDGLFYAGLSKDNLSKKRLYCRQDTLDQLKALDGMEKGIRISGPPGVGKSATTWLWACHKARVYGKSVLWVHVRKGADAKVLMISGNQASMAVLGLDQLPPFVRPNQSDIVIIDGVTREPMHEICIGAVFIYSYNHDRLAVSVASMATRTNEEDDESLKISNFEANPWSIEEYYAAANDDVFFC